MIKQHIFILLLSSPLWVTTHVFAMEDVDVESTGLPTRFERTEKGVEITTDHNASASYQATSRKFNVNPGDRIYVAYEVDVEPGGIMSFGLLNTAGNGWYSRENELGSYEYEVVLGAGLHSNSFLRIVPTSEVNVCLVIRNYHLESEGQTTLTLKKLQMRIENESDSKSDEKCDMGSKIAVADRTTEASSPKPSLTSCSPQPDDSYHFTDDQLSKLAGIIVTKLATENQHLLDKRTPTNSSPAPLPAEKPANICRWCSIL